MASTQVLPADDEEAEVQKASFDLSNRLNSGLEVDGRRR